MAHYGLLETWSISRQLSPEMTKIIGISDLQIRKNHYFECS